MSKIVIINFSGSERNKLKETLMLFLSMLATNTQQEKHDLHFAISQVDNFRRNNAAYILNSSSLVGL